MIAETKTTTKNTQPLRRKIFSPVRRMSVKQPDSLHVIGIEVDLEKERQFILSPLSNPEHMQGSPFGAQVYNKEGRHKINKKSLDCKDDSCEIFPESYSIHWSATCSTKSTTDADTDELQPENDFLARGKASVDESNTYGAPYAPILISKHKSKPIWAHLQGLFRHNLNFCVIDGTSYDDDGKTVDKLTQSDTTIDSITQPSTQNLSLPGKSEIGLEIEENQNTLNNEKEALCEEFEEEVHQINLDLNENILSLQYNEVLLEKEQSQKRTRVLEEALESVYSELNHMIMESNCADHSSFEKKINIREKSKDGIHDKFSGVLYLTQEIINEKRTTQLSLDSADSQICQLKEDNKKCMSQIRKLSTDSEAVQNQKKSLIEKNDKLKIKNKNLEQDLSKNRESNESLIEQSIKFKTLQSENMAKLKSKDNEISRMNDRIKNLARQTKDLSDKKEVMDWSVSKYEAKIKSFEEQLRAQTVTLSQNEANYRNVMSECEQINESKIKEMENKEVMLLSIKKNLEEKLETALREVQRISAKNEKSQATIKSLEDHINRCNTERDKMKLTILRDKNVIEQFETDEEILLHKLEQALEKAAICKEKRTNLEETNAVLISTNKNLEEKLHKSLIELENISIKTKADETTIVALRKEINGVLKPKIATFTKNFNIGVQTISRLESSMEKNQLRSLSKIKSLKLEKDHAISIVRRLKDQIAQETKVDTDSGKIIFEMEAKIQELEQKNISLKLENETLSVSSKRQQEELRRIEAEVAEKRNIIDEKEKTATELKEEKIIEQNNTCIEMAHINVVEEKGIAEKKFAQLEQHIEKLELEKRNLENMLEHSQNLKKIHDEKKEEQEVAIKERDDLIKDLRKLHEKKLQVFLKENDRLRENILHLESCSIDLEYDML